METTGSSFIGPLIRLRALDLRVDDQSLSYEPAFTTSRKALGKGILEQFMNLAGEKNFASAVLRFARTFGPLGAEIDWEIGLRTKPPAHPSGEARVGESLQTWRRLSELFFDVVDCWGRYEEGEAIPIGVLKRLWTAGLFLDDSARKRTEQLEVVLDELSTALTFVGEVEISRASILRAYRGIEQAVRPPRGDFEKFLEKYESMLSSQGQEFFVFLYLQLAQENLKGLLDAQVVLGWDESGMPMLTTDSSLVSHLYWTLVAVLTGRLDFRRCTSCSKLFQSERQRKYCLQCAQAGEPQRKASATYKKRQQQIRAFVRKGTIPKGETEATMESQAREHRERNRRRRRTLRPSGPKTKRKK